MTAISILFVCTGNICRSPMAENYLRDRMASNPEFTFSSAGTDALSGETMPPEALDHLAVLGVVPSQLHSASEVTDQRISSADLILTMTVEHRRAVIGMSPSAMRKAFTLPEFARILRAMPNDLKLPLEGVSDANFLGLVSAVAAYRGVVGPSNPESDDEVVDPYGSSAAVWQHALDQMIPSLDTLVQALTAPHVA